MTFLHMADAAFPANIPPGQDIAAGYYGGPLAFNVWRPGDWGAFPGYRFPIWVAGYDGAAEGQQAVAALQALGVPPGARTAVDMETRRDKSYLEGFRTDLEQAREAASYHEGFAEVAAAGYLVEVYGSASTVFRNPPLNGYWVADYGLSAQQLLALLGQAHVRAVQYATYPVYDASLVKAWTAAQGGMWHG